MIHTTTSPASSVDFDALVRRRRREALDALDRPGAALVVSGPPEQPLYSIGIMGSSVDGEYRSRPIASGIARDLLASGVLTPTPAPERYGGMAYELAPDERLSESQWERRSPMPIGAAYGRGRRERAEPLEDSERAALDAHCARRSISAVAVEAGVNHQTLTNALNGLPLYGSTIRSLRAFLDAAALRRAA
jgi:hypothetical protein